MKLEIFEYIEIWYNRKRRHSALNYATIEEFNNQINYKNVAYLMCRFYLHIHLQKTFSALLHLNGRIPVYYGS